MTKVIGMLVALAMFCALPAVAFGQGYDDGNTVIGGDANAGNGGDGGDGGYDGGGGDGGDGGDNNCAISQTTGEGDNDAECNNGDTFVDADGDGVDDGEGGGGEGGGGEGGDGGGEGGGDVTGGGVGGGVTSVGLARTGFDAWLLAVIGGLSLAGGLGLLAAQRRGRIGA